MEDAFIAVVEEARRGARHSDVRHSA
jgi:hypothetical protein